MSIFQKILFGDLEKFSDEFDTEKMTILDWLGWGICGDLVRV